MPGKQDEYYSSHQKLSFIKNGGQQQLQHMAVLVIGAGGLGCPCLQVLAGAGIGTIGIADHDIVSISNLHRQQLYHYSDAGRLKILAAAEKLKGYNPFIKIETYELMVDRHNILPLLTSYDVIIDCTDNFYTRYLVNDASVVTGKPLVYGAIHQTEGHVTVFNYNNSPTLRCLFPKDENDSIASCAEIGAYNVITNIIGTMMANEVIKIALQHPDVLAGKLNQVDVLTGKTFQLQYQYVNGSREKSMQRFSGADSSGNISPDVLKEKIAAAASFFLIDVRSETEHAGFNIGGMNIPLEQLIKQVDFDFNPSDEIVLYCQKGTRSRQAADYLFNKGFKNAVSLQGGMDQWQKLSANI